MRFRGSGVRLNRNHPLADGIAACIVFDKPHPWGYDAVTGQVFTGYNSPSVGNTQDGRGVSLSGTALVASDSNPRWNVLGDITLAWRGVVRSTGSAGSLIAKIPTGEGGGSNTPFSLEYSNPDAGRVSFGRAAAGSPSFRLWQSGSVLISTGRLITLGVSNTGVMQDTPQFYLDGRPDTAAPALQYGGTGTGAPTPNTAPLIIGRRPDGAEQLDGIVSIAVVAARRWSAAEHALFAEDPYALVASPKRSRRSGALSPLSATITGTVPITGTVTAALALDATITGAVPITGSASATVDVAAQIAGTVPITGSFVAQLDRRATITGLVPITGSFTATSGAQVGDTHDGWKRRSRRQRALEAAERRREAERLADAQALRLELEAALGMAADAVEEAPPAAAEAVQEAVAAVRALPPPAPSVDFVAARTAVADLLAAVEAAMRAKALADDDEDVEFLLRAL